MADLIPRQGHGWMIANPCRTSSAEFWTGVWGTTRGRVTASVVKGDNRGRQSGGQSGTDGTFSGETSRLSPGVPGFSPSPPPSPSGRKTEYKRPPNFSGKIAPSYKLCKLLNTQPLKFLTPRRNRRMLDVARGGPGERSWATGRGEIPRWRRRGTCLRCPRRSEERTGLMTRNQPFVFGQ